MHSLFLKQPLLNTGTVEITITINYLQYICTRYKYKVYDSCQPGGQTLLLIITYESTKLFFKTGYSLFVISSENCTMSINGKRFCKFFVLWTNTFTVYMASNKVLVKS